MALDQDLVDWFNNLNPPAPRSLSFSTFVNEALRAKIERAKAGEPLVPDGTDIDDEG